MWGFAGNMLACLFAAELTGEDRWRGRYWAQAERLLADLEDTDQGPLWTQHLYGQTRRFGPVHGYAGNMIALLRGWDWLSDDQRARVRQAIPATLSATAQRGDMGVNWPPVVPADPARPLTQHCHGAPGMVTALADAQVADAATTKLLGRRRRVRLARRAAGERIEPLPRDRRQRLRVPEAASAHRRSGSGSSGPAPSP